jgi:hypothetical protein
MTTTSEEKLPTIPGEWNLSEAEIASMRDAQRKTMGANKAIKMEQQETFDEFVQNATNTPPIYPIRVLVKENNEIMREYYLKDGDLNYIFAPSFEEATNKVKIELANPNSDLQKTYTSEKPKNNKLRISSDNKKIPPKMTNFSLIPNSNYKYWQITTTNAAASFMSSFRMATQKYRGGKRQKKNKKSKKSKKSKKTKKSKK